MGDITIGQYYSGNSFLHKMDSRMKLLLTFVSIVVVFLCKNFYALGLIVLFTFASTLFSSVPVRMIAKSLKPIIIILIFTAILNIFYSGGGDVYFEWRFIKITHDGVNTALFMAVRIICLVILSSLLTYTTTPTALTDGLERLLSPLTVFKIKVHTLAMMMTLALRFIPTLVEEIERITNAQKARGANLETGNIIERAKALVPILVPLMVSSFRRAYELAFAMTCRGYTGGEGRTRMKQMKLGVRDFVALFVVAGVTAGIILFNHFFEHSI